MDVREVDLPGVGKKFALTTDDGERLTIIIHHTGDREIYNFRAGAYFQPAGGASMDLVLEQLSIEWVKIDAGSKLAGRSIGDLDIRKNTGATVLALLRGKQVIANPQPDELILVGD